jgi:hypothetical protein
MSIIMTNASIAPLPGKMTCRIGEGREERIVFIDGFPILRVGPDAPLAIKYPTPAA